MNMGVDPWGDLFPDQLLKRAGHLGQIIAFGVQLLLAELLETDEAEIFFFFEYNIYH